MKRIHHVGLLFVLLIFMFIPSASAIMVMDCEGQSTDLQKEDWPQDDSPTKFDGDSCARVSSVMDTLFDIMKRFIVPIGALGFIIGALMHAGASINERLKDAARVTMVSSIISVIAMFAIPWIVDGSRWMFFGLSKAISGA